MYFVFSVPVVVDSHCGIINTNQHDQLWCRICLAECIHAAHKLCTCIEYWVIVLYLKYLLAIFTAYQKPQIVTCMKMEQFEQFEVFSKWRALSPQISLFIKIPANAMDSGGAISFYWK